MLFDPREVDTSIESGSGQRQSPKHQPASRRSADGLLTIPVADDCPGKILLKWRTDVPTTDVIALHFEHGALRARDVSAYRGATNAMHEALMAWIARESASWKRLNFECVLMDMAAVQEDIQYADDSGEFSPTSPLYLGLRTDDDDLFLLKPALKAALETHPLLLRTALRLIRLAGSKTIYLRTPDDLFEMFAQWYWDGDTASSDKDAADWLDERYEGDQELIQRYLPSTVRDALCPQELAFYRYDKRAGRYRKSPTLSMPAVKAISLTVHGPVKQVCLAMLELADALKKSGTRRCFNISEVNTQTFHAAATVAIANNDYLGEALDDHYGYLSQNSEGSYFHGYVPLATNPKEIRRQYADLTLGFSILRCADSLLALICTPL